MDQNAQKLAALRSRQVEVTREQVADQTMAATPEWLERISSWTELLDYATPSERNRVYKHILSTVTVDFSANTLIVEWLPAIAKRLGHITQTVSL